MNTDSVEVPAGTVIDPSEQPAADLQPGAVWLAMRSGSRSANRIVQREGAGPSNRSYCGTNLGIWYVSGKRLAWCTLAAWRKWVKTQDGRFSHVSPEHIRNV